MTDRELGFVCMNKFHAKLVEISAELGRLREQRANCAKRIKSVERARATIVTALAAVGVEVEK